MLRQDVPEHLGDPTRPFLETAVREGRVEEAKQWLDYFEGELSTIHVIFGVWDWYLVRYYLDRKDATWSELLHKSLAPWLGTTAGLKGELVAQVVTEERHAHLTVEGFAGTIYITEGDEQFTISIGILGEQMSRRLMWRSKIHAAIESHDIDGFNRLLDIYVSESRLIHDIGCDWAWALLTIIAREWGEAILDEVLRVTEEPWVTARYEKLKEMSVADSLCLTIEGMRGHMSGPNRIGSITVAEESDRFVLSFDACGTGGRMRRGDLIAGSGSRLEAPYHFLNIEGAYNWTWNRKGVCAYCAHCAVVNQILPIERLGRPMRMTEYPENPNDACRWVIYKNPDGFPDKAFINVGKIRGGKP